MNLEHKPWIPPPTTPVKGSVPFADAALQTRVSAEIAAKTAEKDAAIGQLETACGQQYRALYNSTAMNLGTIPDQTGTIQTLVATISRLEGELEYLTQALAGLGG